MINKWSVRQEWMSWQKPSSWGPVGSLLTDTWEKVKRSLVLTFFIRTYWTCPALTASYGRLQLLPRWIHRYTSKLCFYLHAASAHIAPWRGKVMKKSCFILHWAESCISAAGRASWVSCAQLVRVHANASAFFWSYFGKKVPVNTPSPSGNFSVSSYLT